MPQSNDKPNKLARVIAFYLPQFHPIPENDQWWGKGFTEWTNVAKAKPMFRGHYQPHIPADLGFYDLRVSEVRVAQAEMAKEYGIEAFCYYHYWFAGKRLLERPFNEVVESREPDFPFCLCWANETWTGIWHGDPGKVLIKQTYPGNEDHKRHFQVLLKAFKDKRYFTLHGKPLFLIWRPFEIPDIQQVTNLWREMADRAGLKGLYLIAMNVSNEWIPAQHGFDATMNYNFLERKPWVSLLRIKKEPNFIINWFYYYYYKMHNKPTIYSYKKGLNSIVRRNTSNGDNYPWIVPNFDNTPRCGVNGLVLKGSTPELFRMQVKKAIELVSNIPSERRLIFVKSWNEWAEGNHLEPDLRFGKAYLQVVKDEICRLNNKF